jgi:hypothetical protein
MKQTIDFQYPISYVRAGHQTPVRVFGKGSVEIEIREIGAELAPVVFEVGNPVEQYNPTTDLFRKKDDGQLRKVAMIDGDFFVEDQSGADLCEKIASLDTVNETPFGTVSPANFDTSDSYRDGRRRTVSTLKNTTDINEIRRLHGKYKNGKYVSIREELTKDDGGAEMAAALKKRASEIILVDGTIFLKCREPILVMSDYGNKLRVGQRGDTWSANAPYPRQWKNFSSSLRDSAAFLAFMRKNKLFDGRSGEPEFKVHDASVCRYDGTTSDVQFIANQILDSLGHDARALQRGVLDASFVLEDILKREPDRLHAISPRLVSALQQLISTKVSKIDNQSALIAQYQLKRRDISKSNYQQTDVQMARHNFHVAAVVHQNNEGSKAIKQKAILAMERWEAGAGYDRLPVETTAAMFATHDNIVVREANTTWQLRMMCQRAGADYDVMLTNVMNGYSNVEIAHKVDTGTDVYGNSVAIMSPEPTVIVAVKDDEIKVVSNSGAIINDEKALAIVQSYLADAKETKNQADMANAMLKGLSR